jgi:uncharacterized protein (DUF58 family)
VWSVERNGQRPGATLPSSAAGGFAQEAATAAAHEESDFRRADAAWWAPGPRLGPLVAAGAVWLLLATAWRPFLWLAGLWWVALLAAAASDWRALRPAIGLQARRRPGPVLSLGAANAVEVTLRSHLPYPLHCLVRDEPPLDFAGEEGPFPVTLPALRERGLTYHVTPPKRGDFAFGPLHLRTSSALALLRRQLRFDLIQRVKVYPRLTDIKEVDLVLRQGRQTDIGAHLARVKGAGMEFESLRDYQPGDGLRRIDWKATARHGEPFTREYELERSQHVVICLDLGRTMASRLGLLTKVDHAVNAAALLAYVATEMDDWVGLYAFSGEPVTFVPPRKRHFPQVLDGLYALEPQFVESDYAGAFLEASHRLRKRALVVLLTDLPDPDSSARLLNNVGLLTSRHLVVCAAMSDYELLGLAARTPDDAPGMYERTVATALLSDRQRALTALRGRGAIALDVTPAGLPMALLDQYLKIKARVRL